MGTPEIARLNPPELHVPVDNLYTHVVSAKAGRLHRIGGQVPVARSGENLHVGDMAGQLREVYDQVTIALASVGCEWADVVHIYTFTTDMDAYLEAESEIAPGYLGSEPPASTLLEVTRLVERDWLVEVQVDAVGPPARRQRLVPDDFAVPLGLTAAGFRLEPLGPQHNADDYQAWTSSIEHIRQTPGFPDGQWPDPAMTLEQNLGDLHQHAADFARRRGFTYTVLDAGSGAIAGCVYIYPSPDPGHDAEVQSWVRADRAEQDTALRAAVRAWLAASWPFKTAKYEG